MNPLSHNPFELLDRAGLWLAAKLTRLAYRASGISPVAMHHFPRALFIAAGTVIFLCDPAKHIIMPPGLVLFALICLPKLKRDLPAIRSKWDLSLYRRYQARALADRDTFGFRSISLVVVLMMAVMSVNSFSWDHAVVSISDMTMLACLQFSLWFDVADLPEPDDGDLFARPHSA